MKSMDGFFRRIVMGCLALAATAGLSWGQDQSPSDDVKALRELIQQQQKQINALSERLNNAISTPQPVQLGEPIPPPKGTTPAAPAPKALDAKDVQSIVADYLKSNPGVGMPNGVQTGYSMGTGFYIKSVPNPDFANWSDQSTIPWEMRFRGRIQTNYDFYKVQDNYNHLSKQFYNNANSVPPPVVGPANPIGPINTVGPYTVGDFSALEVKRLRLIWEGSLFTPNLTYEMQLDANTRGFGSFQANKAFTNAVPPGNGVNGLQTFGLGGASTIGGQIQTDHAARLFTAWLAYQIPLGSRSSSSVCVPDGYYSYTPSLTFIAGKQQPYFSLIEIFGSATSQFAEFHMADWFFDTDANNMMMAVSAQYRDFDDRLMIIGQIANGADFGIPAVQLQRTPEFIGCFWWDFGGEFDPEKKRWNLFGNSISDLNYSRKLTVRVGGDMNLVHLDPRNQYGDIPSSFYFVGPGAPGGTRFINLFNGGNGVGAVGAANQALQSVNSANIFTYGAFMAAHWRGFSLYNEWYFRYFGDLHALGTRNPNIFYNDQLGNTAVLNRNTFMDYGCAVQAGYFLIPKKFEVMALWSMVNAQSGDLYGTGSFKTFTAPTGTALSPTVTAGIRDYRGAFSNYHMAQEMGIGFNYYWFGQLIKWTNDFSYYRGGNPAGNGAAPAGFIPGVDGWLIRSQVQIAF
jgi:hypothetical protein